VSLPSTSPFSEQPLDFDRLHAIAQPTERCSTAKRPSNQRISPADPTRGSRGTHGPLRSQVNLAEGDPQPAHALSHQRPISKPSEHAAALRSLTGDASVMSPLDAPAWRSSRHRPWRPSSPVKPALIGLALSQRRSAWRLRRAWTSPVSRSSAALGDDSGTYLRNSQIGSSGQRPGAAQSVSFSSLVSHAFDQQLESGRRPVTSATVFIATVLRQSTAQPHCFFARRGVFTAPP